MSRFQGFFNWLDHRTGFRSHRHHLLEEPLPPGTGWWFTTGSNLVLLLAVQVVTGIVLTMYYVPSTAYAYDSVRFIMEQLPFGSILRGLHFFGASFIVIAAVIHMLRVAVFGSYKAPREMTWLTGVVLLLLILGFALTGYLLPWDQKAYWATTVSINIARSGPMGEIVAGIMRGGSALGALTLLRWYSAHVFLLPLCLIGFITAHLYLMRRHGISGPITPKDGPTIPFYPNHALKDTIVNAAVFALLLTFAIKFRAPLDAIADPTDATYVPRPEWYFLSLFQMLKYFPGKLEPVATMVVPGLVVGLLFLLPFLDRRPERHPMKRPIVMFGFFIILGGIAVLTSLGLKDTPVQAASAPWGPLPLAGRQFAMDEACVRCHHTGGSANPIASTKLTRDPDWLLTHVRDPEVIAPGLRSAPPGGMSEAQARSILSYMRRIRAGSVPPDVSAQVQAAAAVFGRYCANCHMMDGEGGAAGPDLSREGTRHDAAWLKTWIMDPSAVDPAANMPPFGERLSEDQLTAIASYLSSRK
jgi:ubiquinol-cytochrome c reductase cytochrome b subunit